MNLEPNRLDSIIIFNKQDMGMGEAYEALQKIKTGYDTLRSAKSGQGLKNFEPDLLNVLSLMLGVSGAGKSSLARTLIPVRTSPSAISVVTAYMVRTPPASPS